MAAEADNDVDTLAFDAVGQSEEDEAPLQELPARPRRRLLTPLTVALLVALAVGCGFIAGVQVQKGEGTSASSGLPAGIASRLGALRSARGAGGASAFALAGGGGGFAGGAGGGVTAGEVAYIRGSTLYVTNSEGNTVKVIASGSKVTKTVSSSVGSIHPGDRVVIEGSTAKGGSIEAASIAVSSAGSSSSTGAASAGGGAGAPALFGAGG